MTITVAVILFLLIAWEIHGVAAALAGVEHQARRAADTLVELQSSVGQIESSVARVENDVAKVKQTVVGSDAWHR